MAGRVLIIGLHFLIQLFQEIVHFVGVAIFKDGEKFIPAVASGKADIGVAGMTVNEERLQSIDFSDTYAKAKQVIIVRAK